MKLCDNWMYKVKQIDRKNCQTIEKPISRLQLMNKTEYVKVKDAINENIAAINFIACLKGAFLGAGPRQLGV